MNQDSKQSERERIADIVFKHFALGDADDAKAVIDELEARLKAAKQEAILSLECEVCDECKAGILANKKESEV